MKTYMIRYISFTEIKFNKAYLLSKLPEERKNKILSFKNEKEQYLSIAMNYFVSKYVGTDATRTEEGKLKSAKGYFTITHSGEYVIFIQTKELSGLAIEKRESGNEEILNYAFDDSDKALIKSPNDFYYLWTLKQSLLNARGRIQDPKDIKNVPSREGLVEYDSKKYYLKSLIFGDYYIGVALEGGKEFDLKLKGEFVG